MLRFLQWSQVIALLSLHNPELFLIFQLVNQELNTPSRSIQLVIKTVNSHYYSLYHIQPNVYIHITSAAQIVSLHLHITNTNSRWKKVNIKAKMLGWVCLAIRPIPCTLYTAVNYTWVLKFLLLLHTYLLRDSEWMYNIQMAIRFELWYS